MRSDSYERIHRTSLSLSLSPSATFLSSRNHHRARNRFAHFSRFHKERKKVACTRGPVWSSAWERETGEAGRKETHLRNSSSARVGVFRNEENVIVSLDYHRVALEPRIDVYYHRLLPDPFFTRLPRFHNSVRRGYFYCSDCSVPARGTSRRGREEFIPGRKVVCRADHGVKSRKIGGPAGCPSQYAPYSESRQIGSTSKTILAENCSTNPYIKCPGYRARSREQGQPRP